MSKQVHNCVLRLCSLQVHMQALCSYAPKADVGFYEAKGLLYIL